jgi:hexosaminidase
MYRRLEYVSSELDLLGLKHRAKYLEMLHRMVGGGDVSLLMELADILKPTGLSARHRARKYSSLIPLNRMVDTVLPESSVARQFDDLVNKILVNPGGSMDTREQIRKSLSSWREIAGALKPAVEQSFLLKEIGPISEMVSELSKRGLESLDYLGSRQKPSDSWKEATAALIDRAEKPQAEMLAAIVSSIKKLVEAANAIP